MCTYRELTFGIRPSFAPVSFLTLRHADYRLMFARIEARRRGEDVGVEAAARLSLAGHTASGILAGMSASCVICPVEHIKGA